MSGYYPGSTPIHPQRLIGDIERNLTRGANLEAAAQYLASVNLSRGNGWEYELKFFPRPTGRATRVIFTEYDLPRVTIEPHDVILDSGMVWFAEFGEQFLGKLDPNTGIVTEYPMPDANAKDPHTLNFDQSGILWFTVQQANMIGRLIRRPARSSS